MLECCPQTLGKQVRTLVQSSVLGVIVFCLSAPAVAEGEEVSFEQLQQEFSKTTQPLIAKYCLDCHSTDVREGELDLERFSKFDQVRRDPHAWQQVAAMLGSNEMPPEDSLQLPPDEKSLLQRWIKRYLGSEARASAGDPGTVVLRRLNNPEYTYTVRDLTGVALSPASEFPVDGAAGEGFTNTGSALAMSPALVSKYLDAAKGIADHMVPLPTGFRFSLSSSRRDWTNEVLTSIRKLYFRYTGDLSNASMLDRWDVTDPTKLTNADGRVDLEAYFRVLIQHRERLEKNIPSTEEIARSTGLSAVYLRRLAEMLTSDQPSVLLEEVRREWQEAKPEDAGAIAANIRAWQDQLWKFNPVGHFGQVQGWQEPVTPLSAEQSFRVKLEADPEDKEVTLYLVAGSSGGKSSVDKVLWKRPRIERPGRPPLMLRDLRGASLALAKKREDFVSSISRYLSAAREAQTSDETCELIQFAADHQVDPLVLESWLQYLGVAHFGGVAIEQHLNHPIAQLAGYDFVKGWGAVGLDALSLVSNASDDPVKIPGDLNPHKIAVHPRPERWVAVGWKSPIAGQVRITSQVNDAHSACGNGVSWSLELRRGGRRRALMAGDVDLGGAATIEPIDELAIQQGELVSLVISARDQNHGCDLTEIEFEISELRGEQRTWSLSADCADSIDAGNPHDDQYENLGVWHFYTGMHDASGSTSAIPPSSQLAKWLDATAEQTAQQLAAKIEALVNSSLPDDATDADIEFVRQVTALDGPLFSQIDAVTLADAVPEEELADVDVGLDPQQFVVAPDALDSQAECLEVTVPSIVEIKIPQDFVAESELIVQGALTASSTGSAQLMVTTDEPPADLGSILPGVPFVAQRGSEAEDRMKQAFDDFRALFPAAMCYPRIVPVDVVVTLVLYHREDEQLSRLMLNEEERTTLDRLWDELHFVSQDALSLITVFQQLLEFASQDDDPNKYKPLGESIRAAADTFRTRLAESEPLQLDAVVDFASRAYRRPLEEREEEGIRQIYTQMRTEEMAHDEALRLTLVRILTSPAFLYRLERPGPSVERHLVSDWELASRLSYFLCSSEPDASLREAALDGLQNPEVLKGQARRMLRDERVRRLAIEFACQWLHIRNFPEQSEKSERHFPTFVDIREDMYEESIQFFTDLFRNDRSVLDILNTDHTFLNESLAKHYGIPDVKGETYQRVEGVRAHSRGGVLAQATVLASQSGASRTSPILRGNWISEILLGERLPRPPQDVPVLPETAPAGLTERQLIEQHSSDPACAKCHARIDPYGFALEEFDAIGRFREKDAEGNTIDTRSELPDGTRIDGIEGLRTYLITTRRQAFLRQFCRKLLGYALGRSVQLSDEPLLEKMMQQLADNEYRVGQAVETIILSDQFRMIRGRDYSVGATSDTTPISRQAP